MKITTVIIHTAILIVSVMPVAFAQETSATINQRKYNQQERIAGGVKSGELTAGETSHLEAKESALNHEEHNMRAADDGRLTAADRAKLTRQQNHLSNQIYRDKHNARVR